MDSCGAVAGLAAKYWLGFHTDISDFTLKSLPRQDVAGTSNIPREDACCIESVGTQQARSRKKQSMSLCSQLLTPASVRKFSSSLAPKLGGDKSCMPLEIHES